MTETGERSGQSDSEPEPEEKDFFSYLGEISPEPPAKRDLCDRCKRPVAVCWCRYLPTHPLKIATTVYILQHPFEEGRSMKTAPILDLGLQSGKCHIWRGKRFNIHKNPALQELISSPKSLLLYPGAKAINLTEFMENAKEVGHCGPYNLILLDGTWRQAKAIYNQNSFLHNLTQVQLEDFGCSEYIIRTQPTDSGLSTVESAAATLAVLEDQPEIREILSRPLKALCDYQLEHGAVKHHSKQYLLERGLLTKQQPRSHVHKAPSCCSGSASGVENRDLPSAAEEKDLRLDSETQHHFLNS